MPEKKRLNCYIYTRVSTEMQVEGYSLDAQRERLRNYAKGNNMHIVKEFSDEGKSGKNTTGRPEFRAMMNLIQEGKDSIDYVLVYKLSRFGRSAADVLTNLQIMQDYGTNLISVEDGIDSSKGSGKLIVTVLAAVAEIERENILAQTMEGRKQKAREGKWNGGQPPYGYRLDKDRSILVIEPKEAEVVKIIFDRYVNDMEGMNAIASYLNDAGYRREPHGNGVHTLFTTDMIKRTLDNPVYMGKIAYGRTANKKRTDGKRNEYHRVKQSEDDYELYQGMHEAIISEELWNEAHARRKETGTRNPKKYSLDHEHLLSGILRCPCCGAKMYGSVNRKKKKDGTLYKDSFYYQCANRKSNNGKKCDFRREPSQEAIDNEVLAVVSYALANSDRIDNILEYMNMEMDVTNLTEELENLKKSKNNYINAEEKLGKQIDSLDMSDPTYEIKYEDLNKRLEDVYREILRVNDHISDVEAKLESADDNKATLEDARDMLILIGGDMWFGDFTDAQKKSILQRMIERVDIFPEKQPDGRWVKSIIFKFPEEINGRQTNKWEYGDDIGDFEVDKPGFTQDIIDTIEEENGSRKETTDETAALFERTSC